MKVFLYLNKETMFPNVYIKANSTNRIVIKNKLDYVHQDVTVS
jgi:hypothetical protein